MDDYDVVTSIGLYMNGVALQPIISASLTVIPA